MYALKKGPIARVYALCRKYAQQNSPQRLIKKLRYRWDKSLKPSRFSNYLSVVALVKNEAEYIGEWLEYHLLQGVEKFYIYDNESTDKLQAVLKPYIEAGIVECIYYPGKRAAASRGV